MKKTRWLQRLRVILLSTALVVIMASQILAQPSQIAKPPQITHPLESLTATEIKTAVTVVKKAKSLSDRVVFPNLSLREPDKAKVLDFKVGDPIAREAFVVVLEPAKNQTYEAIVDLKKASLSSWKKVSSGQPGLVDDDYEVLSTLAKADPRWQAAMKKRGITDLESAVVDGWAMGLMSDREKASGKRLMRGVTYYKDKKRTNYYGSPVEGLAIVIDLNNKKVVEVVDRGVVPFSKANFDYDYDATSLKPLQPAPKPLEIQQPKGVTFKLNKNEVTWQNWQFRYLMHPREGLTLYQVSYNDKGKVRPILYRAGLSEMVVPYADTSPSWAVRSAFDVGEYRYGWLSTTLKKGKDVPVNALLLDALFADDSGSPSVSKDLIAIYEKDAGILWRHYDSNTETYEGHRSRELVLTTVAAIGNYDYGINWVFHEDGTLEVQTDLTGIMLVKATEAVTEKHDGDQFGHLVAPNVLAINHQHFVNFRLDFDVDGTANRVTEMKVAALPKSESNLQSNAFKMEAIPLSSESIAVRDMNLAESRSWMIENATKKNALGGAISYMLMPGSNSVFYPLADSNVRHRGQFANHHLWVTNYKPEELYAAGDYPNQGLPDQGLPQWVSDNESLDGKDIVVWYTMGVTHIPRPEEWPIMTVHRASFKIMSRGFFTQNPVLNVSDIEVTKK